MPLGAVNASPQASLTPKWVVIASIAWLLNKLIRDVIVAVEAGRAEREGWAVHLGAWLTDVPVLAFRAGD